MTLRQCVDFARLLNREASRSVTSLQILEAVDGNSARASGELKETALLLSIPCADDLPEVLNHLVAFLVATVVGVLLPIVDIDIRDAADQKLKLALIENIHQVCGNELVKACDEGIELLLDALGDLPFCDEPMRVSDRSSRLRERVRLTPHIPSCSH